MKLKDHSYERQEDAIIAMVKGQDFYSNGAKVHYDKSKENPFRHGSETLAYSWGGWHRWQIEVRWEDGLKDKKILCWVSNDDKDERIKATMIDAFYSGLTRKYESVEDLRFEYATPVLPDELEHLK